MNNCIVFVHHQVVNHIEITCIWASTEFEDGLVFLTGRVLANPKPEPEPDVTDPKLEGNPNPKNPKPVCNDPNPNWRIKSETRTRKTRIYFNFKGRNPNPTRTRNFGITFLGPEPEPESFGFKNFVSEAGPKPDPNPKPEVRTRTHYTTEIFGLKPNTVEWLTFEKKLHNIPGDARKKMNRLTGLAGNSTIMSPEFSCSNSDDSETSISTW
ncbi:hypothetical protein Fcan01_03766 [Folsomia candida]|uniref:Uncharacterized protein n=1 Tax=Folsomia candida TaxID=158441 RepID=A0A226F1F2_FOLCA|nr:hypothetical protein Fcan01_03766 [Folsomia candida]